MIRDIYYLCILLAVAGFAIYDVYKRRVPNKALVFFLPAALAAPFIDSFGLTGWNSFVPEILYAFSGAAAGFMILLTGAVFSQNGNGVGGGDIKLIAVLGFIYGLVGVIHILMVSSLMAMCAGLYAKKKSRNQVLRLPFVPFIFIGALTFTIFGLYLK